MQSTLECTAGGLIYQWIQCLTWHSYLRDFDSASLSVQQIVCCAGTDGKSISLGHGPLGQAPHDFIRPPDVVVSRLSFYLSFFIYRVYLFPTYLFFVSYPPSSPNGIPPKLTRCSKVIKGGFKIHAKNLGYWASKNHVISTFLTTLQLNCNLNGLHIFGTKYHIEQTIR